VIKRANCTDQGAFFVLLEPPLVRPFSSITMAPYTGFPNLNHNAMASVSRTLWDWLQRFLRLVKMSVCFRPTCLHRLVPFWCFSYHLPLACHCRIDPMPLFECLLSFHPGVCGNRGNGHEREGLVISMNTYSASIQLFYVPFLFSQLTAVGVASFFFRCCINSASNALADCFAFISDEFCLHHHRHQPSYHPRNTL